MSTSNSSSSRDAAPEAKVESATASEPAASEPAASEPAASEPVMSPTVEPAAANDPVAAYRQNIEAYNQHDADAYIAGFAEVLTCFYGEANYPRAKLAKARAPLLDGRHTIPELAFIYQASVAVHDRDDSQAVLADFGYTTAQSKPAVVHHKAVLMRLVDGAWKIAGEASPTSADCLGDIAQGIVAPPLLEPCRKQAKACDCERYCGNRMSNSCDQCLTECELGLADCLGIPP